MISLQILEAECWNVSGRNEWMRAREDALRSLREMERDWCIWER